MVAAERRRAAAGSFTLTLDPVIGDLALCLLYIALQLLLYLVQLVIGQGPIELDTHHERGYEAWALRLLGEITLRLDPVVPDSARGYFEEAIRLAGVLGMRPLIGRAQLGLARLEQQLERPGARDRFAAASALFRELGMTRWLREGEQALARLH